jgi:Holliday junction resolvase-like predicted endonuclease
LLARAEYRRRSVRFDVLAIDAAPDGGAARLTWIRDAFRT